MGKAKLGAETLRQGIELTAKQAKAKKAMQRKGDPQNRNEGQSKGTAQPGAAWQRLCKAWQ